MCYLVVVCNKFDGRYLLKQQRNMPKKENSSRVFRVSLIIIVNNKRITAVPDGGFPPLPCSICWRRVTTTADRTQFYSFHTHTHTHTNTHTHTHTYTHKHMLKGWQIQHAERFVHQEKNKTIYFSGFNKEI